MPATLKKRHKLRIGDRLFLFWDDFWVLHIASEDKRFVVIVRHVYAPWDQKPDGFLPMKVCGPEFPALEHIRPRPLFVAYPEVEDFGSTPGAVRRLIDWCFTPGQTVRVLSEPSQPRRETLRNLSNSEAQKAFGAASYDTSCRCKLETGCECETEGCTVTCYPACYSMGCS